MYRSIIQRPVMKLIGITERTNNANEINPETGKLLPTIRKYFGNSMMEKINNRHNPGTTYCVYTNYESDFTGDYTYFIGEEVTSLDDIPVGFETLTIPEQKYIKFTNGPGPMPKVCIDIWQKVWADEVALTLEGTRGYIADFEVYDERSQHDHSNVTLDVYVGIK